VNGGEAATAARRWRSAAAAWALAVVAFGVVPTHAALQAVAGDRESPATAAGHFAEYALLAFLLAGALGGWRRDLRAALLAGVLAVGLGVAVELVQALLPYRDCQLSDMAVNAAGAALGLALFSAAAPARRGRAPARRG
jgi:VanZ family protein